MIGVICAEVDIEMPHKTIGIINSVKFAGYLQYFCITHNTVDVNYY